MSIRSRLGAAWRGLKSQPLDQLPGFMFQPESKTGISVGWNNALQVSTVLACVSRIADGVAMPPLKVFKPLKGGGAEPYYDHELYRLLFRKPNRWQTSFEFRQTIVFHRALCGNAFVYISRVGGRIFELIPIEPNRVTVKKRPDYTFTYGILGDDGSTQEFSDKDIWHLRGPSWNSWMGLEPVKLAREAIGLALATEETHALMHKNGVQQSGIYSIEGNLTPEQYPQLQKWIESQVGGPNKHKPFILDRSAKFLQTSMSGVDAQHLETRRHQIEEICREFNVRPIMVMHSVKEATFASSEQMFIAHAVYTLNPWWEEIQQSAEANLLDENDEAFIKFNPNILLRGSMEAEANYFSKALGAGGGRGWLTQNDVRAYKDLNPLPGGDDLPMPTNQPVQQSDGNPQAPATTGN